MYIVSKSCFGKIDALHSNASINTNNLGNIIGKFYIMVKEYLWFVFFFHEDVIS